MKGFYIRSIGYQRVKGIIGLINLVSNLCRYEQIVRLNLLQVDFLIDRTKLRVS